jgi:hypothetical protein
MSNIKALNQNKEANNKKEEKNKTKGKAWWYQD